MMFFSCSNEVPEGEVLKAFAAAFGFDEAMVLPTFDEQYPDVQAVLETYYAGTPNIYCATIPSDEYPIGYPTNLEQCRSFTRLASALKTTVFFDPPVLDKYNFPAASLAVSSNGKLALAFDDDTPETYLPVEFDPNKANSVWLNPTERIDDIVLARRTQSGHIILMDLEGFPRRFWLCPNDYLEGVEQLITDPDGRFQTGDIFGSIDDARHKVTLQEIVDETDWDPNLFSSGW